MAEKDFKWVSLQLKITTIDPITEHDLVIILISSLNDHFSFLITALETIAEDNLTWEYMGPFDS